MKVRDLVEGALLGDKYKRTDFALKSSHDGTVIYRSWLRRKNPNDDMMNLEVSRLDTGMYQDKKPK